MSVHDLIVVDIFETPVNYNNDMTICRNIPPVGYDGIFRMFLSRTNSAVSTNESIATL